MKITGVNAHVVVPDYGLQQEAEVIRDLLSDWQWTFVTVDTDEGLQGWGEASCVPRNTSLLTGAGVHAVREALVGEDPGDIERLWQKLYRRYTYLGSRGFPSTILSGIDIALWDLKGKALGRPIYDLLGGKVRGSLRLYANSWFTGCQTPEDYARAAKVAVEEGHDALKLDPFKEMLPFFTDYMGGQISARGEAQGCDIVAAIREAAGPHVEILIDAHGHFNVPTAVRLANRLYDESKIAWFEEPLPPESFGALRSVREQVRPAICVGERLFTRFDFIPIFEQRLADYIMPDVVWTGGISELKKIATLAEAYYVPVSPHNAQGPGQILGGAHVAVTVPNFYRLEHAVSCKPAYDDFLQEPLTWRGNRLEIPDRPGLGVDLNMERVLAELHPAWRDSE